MQSFFLLFYIFPNIYIAPSTSYCISPASHHLWSRSCSPSYRTHPGKNNSSPCSTARTEISYESGCFSRGISQSAITISLFFFLYSDKLAPSSLQPQACTLSLCPFLLCPQGFSSRSQKLPVSLHQTSLCPTCDYKVSSKGFSYSAFSFPSLIPFLFSFPFCHILHTFREPSSACKSPCFRTV